jgi:glycogen debranching enzyme
MLRVADALFDVASSAPDFRLPELYCGFDRDAMSRPVAYPVACSPQAWASAVPLMLLQATLGISARAPDGILTVNEPRLPEWVRHVEIRRMRVSKASIGLAFHREGDSTAFSLLEQTGDARVVMSETRPIVA